MPTFSSLSTSKLKRLSRLVQKRESLLQKVRNIDVTLNAIEGGTAPVADQKTKRREKVTRRGKLKDAILASLKAAGKNGHSVKELADKLKVKATSLYVWFYTTGKKAGIRKSKDGRYRL